MPIIPTLLDSTWHKLSFDMLNITSGCVVQIRILENEALLHNKNWEHTRHFS